MKSFRYIIAALAVALIAAGCWKDNGNSDWPGNQQNFRISRIYYGSNIVKELKDGSDWITVEEQTTPLKLVSEFNWSGDTLKSLKHNDLLYVFEYDDAGHTISATAAGTTSYTFTYNPDGNLSRTLCTTNNENGTVTNKTIDYTWSEGHIKKFSYNSKVSLGPQEIFFSEYEYDYDWYGDVFYTCDVRFSLDDVILGEHNSDSYSFNYACIRNFNPLCGFVLCLDPDFDMPYSDQCFNGLSPYLPKVFSGDFGDVIYESFMSRGTTLEFRMRRIERSDNDTRCTTTKANYKMEFVSR